jgi:hypothetical protein
VKYTKAVVNILIEYGVRMKLVKCLNDTCSKSHIGKFVPYPLPSFKVTCLIPNIFLYFLVDQLNYPTGSHLSVLSYNNKF